MIGSLQLTQAGYAIFLTQMAQANVPPVDANQSINEFWQYEWDARRNEYRAQARAAFEAAGLEVASEPPGRSDHGVPGPIAAAAGFVPPSPPG